MHSHVHSASASPASAAHPSARPLLACRTAEDHFPAARHAATGHAATGHAATGHAATGHDSAGLPTWAATGVLPGYVTCLIFDLP